MNPLIIFALIAIALAFLAGVLQQRKASARDILKAVRRAADLQAETTSHLYSSLLVINGYEIDNDNKVRPHQYPARKIKEARDFLEEIGLFEKS